MQVLTFGFFVSRGQEIMDPFVRYLLFFGLLVGLLLSLSSPKSAQAESSPKVGLRPDAPTYAVHGPYWVGVQDHAITFNYPDGMTRESRVAIWYPAGPPADESATFTYPAEPRVVEYGGPLYFPRLS